MIPKEQPFPAGSVVASQAHLLHPQYFLFYRFSKISVHSVIACRLLLHLLRLAARQLEKSVCGADLLSVPVPPEHHLFLRILVMRLL